MKQSFYQEIAGSHLQTLWDWVGRPGFSYLMLFLLQLKVVWGAWEYRDLTGGDTSSYFSLAYLWFKNFKVNIVWSPLYTAFYGTLLHLSSDVYAATILHRLMIVFALSMMILVLMRRLLPPGIAWLISAWWAVVPVNFDPFEVHLFAVIPVLAAWLLILHKPSPWTRGGAIGILFGASILVRNELIVVTSILTMICIFWEIWLVKKIECEAPYKFRAILMGYGLPLLLAGLLSLFFYTRSIIQFPALPAAAAPKHTVNMCQAYSFGYKQRHPEWDKDHWTECDELMMAHFGKKLPSLPEMIQRNPRAVLEHVLWNIGLIPNGVQVSLFGATSGIISPDYIPVPSKSTIALVLSVIAGVILVIGSLLLYWKRDHWWTHWFRDRTLGWLAMLATLTVTVFIIIPTQRPRPEYLYALTIFLMAFIGTSVFVIAFYWPVLKQLSNWMPIVMVMILFISPYYYANPNHMRPRELLEVYRRLNPFQDIVAKPDTVFLKGEYAFAVSGYIGHRISQVFDYRVLDEIPSDMPLEVFLNERDINLFYVDDKLWSRLIVNSLYCPFLLSPESVGWKLIAFQDGGTADKWMLFQKMSDLDYAGSVEASLVTVDLSLAGVVTVEPQLQTPPWGIEVYDDDSLLWLGHGQPEGVGGTLWTTKRQAIQAVFEVEPGRGRSDSWRTVEVTLENVAGVQKAHRQFDKPSELTFTAELQPGRNDFQFIVLDEATILKQPNGDTCPWLVLLHKITVKPLP